MAPLNSHEILIIGSEFGRNGFGAEQRQMVVDLKQMNVTELSSNLTFELEEVWFPMNLH